MENFGIAKLFGIKYPIIQGGMVWASSGKLAAAVSNAGGLGLIGAGSMTPEILKENIEKAKSLTNKPIGVNFPLLYSRIDEQIEVALQCGIKIFFTSAGSPKKFTPMLKEKGCTVVHVTSSPLLAGKCEAAGVNAIVAEGFEAGGHNGREEITTMCLIPQVADTVKIPIIAAGGIGDGRGILSALALGAQGVQMGTRFLATQESSAHKNFKKLLTEIGPDGTLLSLKKRVPARLVKNKFFQEIFEMEQRGANKEELSEHLGRGRAKLGMFDGDLNDGELEAGQISGLIKDVPTTALLFERLIKEYNEAKKRIS